MLTEIIVAIGLVIALEGALYAGAPSFMKNVMKEILKMPDEQLRNIGLGALVIGVLLVWIFKGI